MIFSLILFSLSPLVASSLFHFCSFQWSNALTISLQSEQGHVNMSLRKLFGHPYFEKMYKRDRSFFAQVKILSSLQLSPFCMYWSSPNINRKYCISWKVLEGLLLLNVRLSGFYPPCKVRLTSLLLLLKAKQNKTQQP